MPRNGRVEVRKLEGGKGLKEEDKGKIVELVEEIRDENLEELEIEDRFVVIDEGIEISKEEKAFLNLGLKFRLTSGLDKHQAEVNVEKWCVKNRWTLAGKE